MASERLGQHHRDSRALKDGGMSEHTPGPWKVVGLSVISDSGIICNPPSGPIDELEANARLIAAAPDMLEALEAMRDAIIPTEDCYAAILADAAIAKAIGETA